MRLLAENAALLEFLTKRPSCGIQFDANPQTFASNFDNVGAAETLQVLQDIVAEFRRAGGEVLIYNHSQRGPCDGASEGISSEGAAMISGAKDSEDFARAEYG
jgi:hypothetical protein